MQFLRHMSENLFVTFTGIAALVHSTWSLGTMFSGVAPSGDWWAWTVWVLPAFFVAFAMDIGQISTSAAIRHNGLTRQRALAFFVFAVATYYLQFLYIAHHMPSLAIATGVSELHQFAVKQASDAAIWILPLLLPLSTLLYTISDGDKKEQKIDNSKNPQLPTLEAEKKKNSGDLIVDEQIIQEPSYTAFCESCGWSKDYEDPKKAERALNTHQSVHCKSKDLEKVIASNGHIS